MDTISDVEVAWLAGILEGEGSFMMSRNHVKGKVYLYPKVVVSMTDEDIIQRAASLFGTKVYMVPKTEGRKQAWRAGVTGSTAVQLMNLVAPYMGKRRTAKIEEILEQYNNRVPTDVMRSQSCAEVAKTRMRNNEGQFV